MNKAVDVIIPVHDQVGLVLKCVESLRGQSRLGRIIIIDDASSKDTREALKDLVGGVTEDLVVYHNQVNKGFIHSTGRGVKKSIAPYFLLLNSDAFAHAHAIEHMAKNLDNGYAVCGARLVFAQGSKYGTPGTIQHAGVGFYSTGIPYHPFMNMPGDAPAVQTWREVNAVTGAAMMVKRDVWEELRGWDKRLGFGVYEDVEFCIRVKKSGYGVVYEPRAVFDHLMHASQVGDKSFFTQERHNANLAYLFSKHGQRPCDDEIFYKVGGRK